MKKQEITQTGVGTSNPIPLDTLRNPFNVGFGCTVTGTVTDYTIEHTFDDTAGAAPTRWFSHPAVVNQGSSQDGTYAFPVKAIRIRIAAGTGAVLLQAIQAGHKGA